MTKLLHQKATPEALSFLRVWIFGVWFVLILFDPLPSINILPGSYFQPVGLLLHFLPPMLKSVVLTAPFLMGLKISTLIVLWCIILNKWTNVASLVSCVLLTVYQSLIRGFGYVNHAELTLLYAVYLWTLFLLFRKQDQKSGGVAAIFVAITLVFCLTYTLTGIYRFVYGGWNVFQEHNLLFWIVENANRSSYVRAHADQWVANYPFLWNALKLGFSFVTVFEILAPFSLISRPFRYAFLCIMIPFHLFTWILMDIVFIENLLLFVLLVDLTPWLAPKTVQGEKPIIYFDGVCNLCNGFVDWLIKRDRTNIFKFASLQGKTAEARLGGQQGDVQKWSVLLSDEKGVHKRSVAAIRILSSLGGVGKLANLLWLIPEPLRDFGYTVIARYRYAWFGKRDVCRLPGYEEREKFLP